MNKRKCYCVYFKKNFETKQGKRNMGSFIFLMFRLKYCLLFVDLLLLNDCIDGFEE